MPKGYWDKYEQFTMWLDLEMKIEGLGPLVIRLGGICMNKHWISLYQNCWSVLEDTKRERETRLLFLFLDDDRTGEYFRKHGLKSVSYTQCRILAIFLPLRDFT